ncbi:LysR family transcriptional regulator [Leucobacter sp. CSA1]|uniref:LysR family transcriptional regulator n=1 Tax=Leucobacter chromiisoli TaxID=2796471 RepID=A0A934Q8U8_9MICO|nr:LysR family transcriptional regulator [Leucobacter chromiisoli]MBK0418947.1 LysR family transcriptional regulator [Leucobacter chromiisoli]
MIDLRQLEALRAVGSEGSVARAARRLGWSQPTVDYHLRNLDRLVGAPLLQRSTRGSAPTPAGALMLERAAEILTLADRALVDVRSLAEAGHVRLRFGTFPTAAARLLPSIAAQVSEWGIELDATLEEVAPLVAHVNQRELDAVLVYSVPGYDLPFRSDVSTTEVLRDPLQLAVPESHPLASRESIDRATLVALSQERWLLGATRNDPMDSVVVDAFAEAGRTIDVSIRTDDFSVMLGMIAAGMSIGLVPKLASGSVQPGVALLPIDDPAFARSILIAAPGEGAGREPSPAVRRLAAAVRHAIEVLD